MLNCVPGPFASASWAANVRSNTADLEPLSNYSGGAEGGGGRATVIGQTKDDIIGKTLATRWNGPTGCAASRCTR